MKTYIVTKKEKGRDVTFRVYRIKRNTPTLIGKGNFEYGANKGIESEAMDILLEKKEISQNLYDKMEGFYTWTLTEKYGIKIIALS